MNTSKRTSKYCNTSDTLLLTEAYFTLSETFSALTFSALSTHFLLTQHSRVYFGGTPVRSDVPQNAPRGRLALTGVGSKHTRENFVGKQQV